MTALRAALPLVAAFLLVTGCATRPRVSVAAETTEPTSVGDGTREIAVRVTASDTVVRIGDATFTLAGYRGYIGQLDGRAGWIEAGKVQLRWRDREITIQGPKSWANIVLDLEDARHFVVDQEGRTSRSVFKP